MACKVIFTLYGQILVASEIQIQLDRGRQTGRERQYRHRDIAGQRQTDRQRKKDRDRKEGKILVSK